MDLSYRREERLNAITHGAAALLGLVGFYYMLIADLQKSPYSSAAIIVYSLSLIMLFTASTLYHAVSIHHIKLRLRILDHISIYYLIAGTYTPVALITLLEGNGWLIFTLVWGMALGGTILKIFFTGKFEVFSLLLYLFMGWMIVFDLKNLIDLSSEKGMLLLFLGGAFYTVGIFFYAVKRIPYNHLIWHLFVIGGAASHWLYIYSDVI